MWDGHSFSGGGGALLDGGSLDCVRKGRFSIVTARIITLAFICYNKSIQISIIICIRFILLFVALRLNLLRNITGNGGLVVGGE